MTLLIPEGKLIYLAAHLPFSQELKSLSAASFTGILLHQDVVKWMI